MRYDQALQNLRKTDAVVFRRSRTNNVVFPSAHAVRIEAISRLQPFLSENEAFERLRLALSPEILSISREEPKKEAGENTNERFKTCYTKSWSSECVSFNIRGRERSFF